MRSKTLSRREAGAAKAGGVRGVMHDGRKAKEGNVTDGYNQRDLEKFKQLQREFGTIRAEETRRAADRLWRSGHTFSARNGSLREHR